MALGEVIKGEYAGKTIVQRFITPLIHISGFFNEKKILLNRSNVKSWQVLGREYNRSSGLSGAVAGGLLFGKMGAIVGAVVGSSGSNSWILGVEYICGDKSIIAVDNVIFAYFRKSLADLEVNGGYGAFLDGKSER